jgi:peptidoglycan/LPS O-acetylase OafA/YrhL
MQGLAWMGRWSLSYYMLHQPLLIGALSLLALLR